MAMESSVEQSPRAGGGLVVRPARLADLEAVLRVARAAGPGMTNLQPNRALLTERLTGSEAAIASAEVRAQGAPIFFVVERVGDAPEDADDRIVGTALIYPRIGVEWPFYSYRLTRQAQTHKAHNKVVAHDVLLLANDFDGAAEVGGLFVESGLRGLAAGRLAARSRYLFLAAHRDWFGRQVISEMRGYQDENGDSPVWEALGREFYDMDFDEADRLNAHVGNQFIADLSPKHPIYASLLAKPAREALGRPHDDGRRAMALLLEEGFRYEGYIDIFDGGPTLFANIDELKAVREARADTVVGIEPDLTGVDRLACVGHAASFRAARGTLVARADGVVLHPTLAAALGAVAGDRIIHVGF